MKEGDRVEQGDALMILEAMKMKYIITAPYAGKVESIRYRVGDQGQEGAELLVISSEE